MQSRLKTQVWAIQDYYLYPIIYILIDLFRALDVRRFVAVSWRESQL